VQIGMKKIVQMLWKSHVLLLNILSLPTHLDAKITCKHTLSCTLKLVVVFSLWHGFCPHESSHLVLPTKFHPEITHNQFKNILGGSLSKWFYYWNLISNDKKKNNSSRRNISLLTKCKPANVSIVICRP
jgi:hypothetical protein